MQLSRSALLTATAVLAFTACRGDSIAAPARASGSGGGTDTSGVAPSFVNLSGHVFAVENAPAGQGSDTLRYVPIGGVPLRLMHNILVNGQSAQELAGRVVADAGGTYRFDNLPSGYYVLYAEPAAGSGWSGSYSLVPAQQAAVTIDVFVWKTN